MAERLDHDLYYQRIQKMKLKKVGDQMAVYIPSQRAIHVLNQTTLFLWECLKEPVTFEELLFMLTEAFKGERKTMKKDLEETLDLFLEKGLIRKVR